MRRLTLLALAAIVVLSACNDNRESPTEPATPAPEETFGSSCDVTRFPLLEVSRLIPPVFPTRRLRVEAGLRAAAIAFLWNNCRPVLARRGVAAFVEFMNLNAASLTSPGQQTQLINLMFTGVGLSTPPPVVLGPDFGIGTVDPDATEPTRIETEGNTGLIEFEPGDGTRPPAFDEFTVVSIHRHPDAFRLDGFPEEDQYPPFWDYTATNASGNHRVADGAVARMAFCLLSTGFPSGYPDGVRIGHNPDPSEQPPPFEIIPEDEDVAEFADDLICSNLEVSLGEFGGGLFDIARTAGRFLAPLARALFVPQRLMAVAVGNRGPLGGLPPTLSDFGVVNATSYFGYEDGEATWDNDESFWNRRTSAAVSNSAYPDYVSTFDLVNPESETPLVVPGGTVPPPFRKFRSGWYGQFSTGNYIGTQRTIPPDALGSGGTGTTANSGSFVSPELEVPNVAAEVELRFKTWWEIEGVNPGRNGVGPYDIMDVFLEADGEEFLAQLNPAEDPAGLNREAKPYTSGGFNTAPVWQDMAIDISDFKGQSVRIRFEFTSRDENYNGFRGWFVEDVRVSTGTSEAAEIRLKKLQRSQGNVVPGRDLPPVSRE